jgi:hypothetical protein
MKHFRSLVGVLLILLLVFAVSAISAQGAIKMGDVVAGTLVADSGGDSYVISLSAGDIISVAVDSDVFDAVVYVNDAAGTELAYEDYGGEGNNALALFIAPADGDYTIVAAGWSSSAEGDYTVSVVGIVPDMLAYDSSVDASYVDEVSHYFVLDGMAGDVINIFADSGEQDMDMEFTLYNLAGETLATNSDGSAGVDPAIVRFLVPENGKYVLESSSWFDELVTGVLTVTVETTKLLQVDAGPITITVGDRFDYDVVRFTGVTNGTYRISLVSQGSTITANATIAIDDWSEINLHIEGALQGNMDFLAPHDGYVEVVVEPGFWSDGVTIEINIEAVD